MTEVDRPVPTTTAPGTAARSRVWVVALCWLVIVVDGYDLIVYGTVLPALVAGEWALTPVQAGRIGSAALVGMLVGALGAGIVTDRVGRRRLMVGCIAWFSLAMAACALAPTPEVFGALRFVAGIGLGGVVPTAIALTVEYAPPGRRNATNAVMFSGYSVGGVLAALAGIALLETTGWRTLFWLGAGVGAVLVVVAWAALPESPAYLAGRGRHDEAAALAARYGTAAPAAPGPTAASTGARTLLAREHRRTTLLLWLATGMGLLLVYGLNTWLAQIMRQAGYDLGPALAFLLALNLGAIVGTPLLGSVADRLGARPVAAGMFLTAAAAILVLTTPLPTPVLLAVIAVAGACTIGTTIIVNSFTATSYPEPMRAAALGWALGVGRVGAIVGPIYGGLVLATGWGLAANFVAFAIPAALGAVFVALVPRRA